MITRVRQWLEPPHFPGDEEKNTLARTMNTVGLYFVAALIITAVIFVPFLAKRKMESWSVLLVLFVLYGVARHFMARGNLKLASMFMIASGWVMCAGLALLGGGITSPLIIAVVAITIIIGLLFPPRIGNAFLLISLLGGLGLAGFQQSGGMLPRWFTYPPLSTWFFLALALVFMNRTMALVVGRLETTLARERQENAARRQAETTLRESEKKYRLLADNMMDFVSAIDLSGRLTYVSPSVERMLGYSFAELQALPRDQYMQSESIQAMDRAMAEEMARELAGGADPNRYRMLEIAYICRDGSSLICELKSSALRDENGAPIGVQTVGRDITERKQVEEALRRSYSLLSATLESTADGIWVVDATGKVARFNQVFLDLWQIPEALTAAPDHIQWHEFMAAQLQDPVMYLTDVRELYQNPEISAWDMVILRNGKVLECYSQPQRIEGVSVGRVWSFRDITERKRAEEALKESEAKYRSLFENASVGIFHSLPEGKFLEVNPALATILGYKSPQEMVFSITDIGAQLYVDSKKRTDIVTVTMQQSDWVYAENRYRCKDGSILTANLAVRKVLRPDGTLAYLEGFVEDITARKQAEENLRRSEAKFRAVVENSNDGILFCDAGANVSYRSPSYNHINGFTDEEGLGHSGFETVHPDDLEALRQRWAQIVQHPGVPFRAEYRIRHKNGTWRWIDTTAQNLLDNPDVQQVVVASRDITERKQAEDLIRLRLELMEFAVTHSLDEVLQKTLDDLGRLTDSPIGFYHFVESDQQTLSLQTWSTRTMLEFCRAEGKGLHYPIDQAGVWVDCIYARQPVIHNDYATLPHRRGMPPGHALVIRELVVPILRADKVVAILGVGNKPADYTEADVRLVAYFADVAWEIAERKRTEEQIKQDLAEKEALLMELYHRTKNNMQVIIAMLQLQAAAIQDPPTLSILRDTENRIHTMALAHQMLYDAQDLSYVNLRTYITDLTELVLRSHQVSSDQIRLVLDVQDVQTVFDVAIPCGLILNELLSNAFEHAFPGYRSGEIHVQLQRAGADELLLCVADNGVGAPAGFDFRTSGSMGLQIVSITAEHQLQGRIEFENGAGVTCRVWFKDTGYVRRV